MDSVSTPSRCVLAVQKSVYWYQHGPTYAKVVLVTLVAIPCFVFFCINVSNTFYRTARVSLLIVGTLLNLSFLGGIFIYLKTGKYYEEASSAKPDFLTKTPLWWNQKAIDVTEEELRAQTQYHDWFTRNETNGLSTLQMGDYVLQEEGDQVHFCLKGKSCYTVSKDKMRCTPFLKGDDLYLQKDDMIYHVLLKQKDHELQICPIQSNEELTLIRQCDSIVILGYRSGLVQLFDSDTTNTNTQVAYFYGLGEILDCWVDPDKHRIITYSNDPGYLPFFSQNPRKRLEIFQFAEEK